MICFKASSSPPTKVTTSDKLCFRWQEEICPETWFSQNQSLLPQNFLFFNYLWRGGPDCKCISIINAMKQGRPSFPPVAIKERAGRLSLAPTLPLPTPPATRSPWGSPSSLQQRSVRMALGCAWAHLCDDQVCWFHLRRFRLSSCNSKLAWCWM